MQCRAYAAQLGRLYSEFQSEGTELLIILGDSLERARSYARQLKLANPVLADPERSVYHTYGLDKAMLVIQRTATVLVDKEGIIRHMKRTTNPMTWLQEAEATRRVVIDLSKTQGG
ncbi:MAG: peroxiredoxin family protein [Chloroflexi bacterium]|nr:peroxiredoxin family protein [Chloroflexota bacterium]